MTVPQDPQQSRSAAYATMLTPDAYAAAQKAIGLHVMRIAVRLMRLFSIPLTPFDRAVPVESDQLGERSRVEGAGLMRATTSRGDAPSAAPLRRSRCNGRLPRNDPVTFLRAYARIGLALTKDRVDRELVCEGDWCSISYALRADGRQAPAKEIMEHLDSGSWIEGEVIGMHADEQVDTYAKLMYTMQHYAQYGDGDRNDCMNALDHGIFEFKAGRARIAFYDTPGDGTHEPKKKIIDRDRSPSPDSVTWFIPDLDRQLRLCTGWPKKSRLAQPSDIRFTCQVRAEDLTHDRGSDGRQ